MSREFGMLANKVLRVPIWPWPVSAEDMGLIREAKQAMGLATKMLPVESTATEPGRILALREAPPWVAPYALIKDPTNSAALTAALKWAIIPGWEDKRATDTLDILKSVWPTVRELDLKEQVGENLSKYMDLADTRVIRK